MVGLTRFLILMNLCEKSAASSNVYKGFCLFKKDVKFATVKKLFVLQETETVFRQRRSARNICSSRI